MTRFVVGLVLAQTRELLWPVGENLVRAGKLRMSDSEDNVNRDLFRSMQQLRDLRIEHRDLDDVIARLSMDLHIDELQLKRLKKRKLVLKDQILKLESELIPDLNA